MDLRHLFLRYSFVVNLILLFAIAFTGAGAVNKALANRVQSGTAQTVALAAPPAPPPEFRPDSGSIVTRDLFKAAGSSAQVAEGGTAGGGADSPEATNLRLKLLGVLFYGEQNPRNIATIQNLQDQKSEVYRSGLEVAPGAKLAEVMLDRVVLERSDGRREELLLNQEGGSSPVATAEEPRRGRRGRDREAAAEPDPAGGVQQVSDTEFVVQQAAISSALSNMSTLMTQARIIPNFVGQGEERKVDGFRIFRIQQGSVFRALGLNDGDVIKAINGQRMDSLESGLNMLKGLTGQTAFSIDLERQREPRTHNYKVQ